MIHCTGEHPIGQAPAAAVRAPVHLSDDERGVLLALIRQDPAATLAAVRDRFEAWGGRRVSVETVRRAYSKGYKPARPGDRSRPLSADERSILGAIAGAMAPDYNRTELARRFRAATGRGIQVAAVRRFLRDRMGVAPGKPGRPRKGGAPC